MPAPSRQSEPELQRLSDVKRLNHFNGVPLGPELLGFFKQSIQKRHTRFSKIAESWETLIPSILEAHCCLESFSRGTLTVLVDSAPHLYELKQLLLSGLQKQLLIACRQVGLKKISLKPGRWYDGDSAATGKLRFS
jgi:Dna[CI] antecedent, DciA